MTETLGQLHWQQCVEQAAQDILMLVDAANNLSRIAEDAERDTTALQHHVFPDDVDQDQLVRTGSNLKHEVANHVGRLRDRINDIASEIVELGRLARDHQQSL